MNKDVLDRIKIKTGDITKEEVDAIVNAANSSLLGGGGVDGAIHRAAGPELLTECAALGGCPPGEAKVTRGYRLPCRFVIHTVGPIWRGGNNSEESVLADAYRNSMKRAAEIGARTVAFPAISTGVYRFPPQRAAEIAVSVVAELLSDHAGIREVRLVCFSAKSENCHLAAFEAFKKSAVR